jgi:hypothetical protein
VAELSTALTDPETQANAAEIIHSLVDEIRLVPEDDHLRIDLRGELAGILALAWDSKNPAAAGDGLELPCNLQSR